MREMLLDGVDAKVQASISLCRIYALLAQGLGYPDRGLHLTLCNNEFGDEIRVQSQYCCPGFSELVDATHGPSLHIDMPYHDLCAEYLQAFETDAPSPSAALNEGVYAYKTDRPALMLELKSFYRNFGLQINSETNELADTITAELEFMQFLCVKESQARVKGLSPDAYVLAQRDFLARHLTLWLPEARLATTKTIKSDLYKALVAMADDVTRLHLAELHKAECS